MAAETFVHYYILISNVYILLCFPFHVNLKHGVIFKSIPSTSTESSLFWHVALIFKHECFNPSFLVLKPWLLRELFLRDLWRVKMKLPTTVVDLTCSTQREIPYIYIYIYIYACQYTWRHTQRTAENVVVSTILYPVGRFHTFIGHEGP